MTSSLLTIHFAADDDGYYPIGVGDFDTGNFERQPGCMPETRSLNVDLDGTAARKLGKFPDVPTGKIGCRVVTLRGAPFMVLRPENTARHANFASSSERKIDLLFPEPEIAALFHIPTTPGTEII